MSENTGSELSTLADVYLRHHSERREEDFWAFEEVQRIVQTDFSLAWVITRLLVEKANSDVALNYVAAGPLEDFVDGYGDAAVDVIEAACEQDQWMQFALSGIWLERESRVLTRWRGLMTRYGFMGERQPLSRHPDCWF
jgi:hypothetical protein